MSNIQTTPHNLGEAVESLRRKWASITAFGVLLVMLGFAALFFSLIATIATVTLNGVLFLIAGAAEIGIGMHSRSWGQFFLWVIGGLLYLAAGVLCIMKPQPTPSVVRQRHPWGPVCSLRGLFGSISRRSFLPVSPGPSFS